MPNKTRALALISGGLDSVLAVKVISEQDIEVIGVTFLTPFCDDDFSARIKRLAEQLNIKLKLVDISKEFIEMLKSPRYGYGKNLNPCIDCRILELKKAHQLMKELNASFIITGEVLGQRPMSQNKNSMGLIEKRSGVEGLLVRPLCGKLFAPTIAEKAGWIDRNKLLDINGRSRKRQYELAKEFKISGYGAPAGGCLLTDPEFSLIVKDLLGSKMLDAHSIRLVKNGRYFKISESFKLIVGRDQEENQKLMQSAGKGDIIFIPNAKGPIAIGFGKQKKDEISIACRIIAFYCKPSHRQKKLADRTVVLEIKISIDGREEIVNSGKISEQELSNYRI